MYVPSPFELSAIESSRDIWPRAYGPKSPPSIEDLPKIYDLFQRQHQGRGDEVKFFRSLAITSILAQWDSFKDLISYRVIERGPQGLTPELLYKWIQKEKCTMYGQELAYRLVFWEQRYLMAVASFFRDCDATSFHALWFELLALEQTSSSDPKAQQSLNEKKSLLRDRFQQKRERANSDSFEYFLLTQAFAALDLKLAHEK